MAAKGNSSLLFVSQKSTDEIVSEGPRANKILQKAQSQLLYERSDKPTSPLIF